MPVFSLGLYRGVNCIQHGTLMILLALLTKSKYFKKYFNVTINIVIINQRR